MSVVYQVGICGPDPRSLLWNGSFAQIDYVKCYEVGQPVGKERPFKDSVDEELLKLRQVIANGGAKFAANVSLVLVGNEIFFSRGVCSNGGAACTDSRDCGSGTCNIGHYCSNQLTGNSPSPTCASSATCSSGASCTDVANVSALKYAFDRVQPVLAQLGGTPPPISISLQMDLLVSPSFGDDPKTAPLMFSRQQLGQALPDKIIATNTYPDQWGNVTVNQLPTTCSGGSFASCVGPQNAVLGQALLAGCVDDPRYRDPVTGKIAHTIDNYFTRLQSYYPGFDLVIAETGWHTSGTCVAYNDCASTYSAGDAATYYQDLYAYVQTNKIPLLAFQPFDQRTKLCDPAGRPHRRGRGELRDLHELLPAQGRQPGAAAAGGARLAWPEPGGVHRAPRRRLDPRRQVVSPQTLVGVIGVGSAGICEHNTNIACNGGYDPAHPAPGLDKCPPGPGAQANRCVWGYCANDTTIGCNPDDPDNVTGCGVCKRAGNCYGADPPGLFAANVNCGAGPRSCVAACRNAQGCNGALAPFTDSGKCGEPGHECACFVAMAPSSAAGQR